MKKIVAALSLASFVAIPLLGFSTEAQAGHTVCVKHDRHGHCLARRYVR